MEPPQSVKDAICRVQEHRGWILSSYAQIEYLFSDLVNRACAIKEYVQLGDALPFPIDKRLKRSRRILETEGPFSPYAKQLLEILDEFEDRGEMRNILAHGFMTVLHDPNDQVQYEFRKWHWPEKGEAGELVHKCFEVHLDYESCQLMALADKASNVFRQVHLRMGWGE